MREWLVIEKSWKCSVFATEEDQQPTGYIPRDAAEKLLGRDLGGTVWFTAEESERMRKHPEFTLELPERRGEVSFKEGDWVVLDLKIGQIKRLDEEEGTACVSDGFAENSGRVLDRLRPLTLRNKRIADTFQIYYNRLHEINGYSGFNWSEIYSYFAELARHSIDNVGSNEADKKVMNFLMCA